LCHAKIITINPLLRVFSFFILRKLFMTTLTQAIPRDYELGEVNEFLLLETTIVYEGAAVGLDEQGYARSLQTGDRFVGFCEDTADNSGGKSGDRRVRVKHAGKIKLSIEGLAFTHVGQTVFASNENTFTLTAEHNSRIGVIYRVEADGTGIVAFNAAFCHSS
jgi:hypothetical protein